MIYWVSGVAIGLLAALIVLFLLHWWWEFGKLGDLQEWLEKAGAFQNLGKKPPDPAGQPAGHAGVQGGSSRVQKKSAGGQAQTRQADPPAPPSPKPAAGPEQAGASDMLEIADAIQKSLNAQGERVRDVDKRIEEVLGLVRKLQQDVGSLRDRLPAAGGGSAKVAERNDTDHHPGGAGPGARAPGVSSDATARAARGPRLIPPPPAPSAPAVRPAPTARPAPSAPPEAPPPAAPPAPPSPNNDRQQGIPASIFELASEVERAGDTLRQEAQRLYEEGLAQAAEDSESYQPIIEDANALGTVLQGLAIQELRNWPHEASAVECVKHAEAMLQTTRGVADKAPQQRFTRQSTRPENLSVFLGDPMDEYEQARSAGHIGMADFRREFLERVAVRRGVALAEYEKSLAQAMAQMAPGALREEVSRILTGQALMLIERLEAIGERHGIPEDLRAWHQRNLDSLRRAIADAAGLREVQAERDQAYIPELHDAQHKNDGDSSQSSGVLRIERVLKPGYWAGAEASKPARKAVVLVV